MYYTRFVFICVVLGFICYCCSNEVQNSKKDFQNKVYIVKLRGLPWSATAEQIGKFFSGCQIKNETSGIHIVMTRQGRPSGEAFVEMVSEKDVELACAKDQEYMAHRYIEVSRSGRSEMDQAIRKSRLVNHRILNDSCIRVRGLPFQCCEEDIEYFFDGLEIVPNGIVFKTDFYTGKNLGEAFVQFTSIEMAERALEKHMEKMLHRYIEVFRSSLGEMRLAKLNQHRTSLSQAPNINYHYYSDNAVPAFSGDFGGRPWRGNYRNNKFQNKPFKVSKPNKGRMKENKTEPLRP